MIKGLFYRLLNINCSDSSKKGKKKQPSVSSSDEGVNDPNPALPGGVSKQKTTKTKKKKVAGSARLELSEDEGVEDSTLLSSGPIKNNEMEREDDPSQPPKVGRSRSKKAPVKSKAAPVKSKKNTPKPVKPSEKSTKSVNKSNNESVKSKKKEMNKEEIGRDSQ